MRAGDAEPVEYTDGVGDEVTQRVAGRVGVDGGRSADGSYGGSGSAGAASACATAASHDPKSCLARDTAGFTRSARTTAARSSAARIQRLAQALVADVDAVGPEADDEVARQVRLEEFAGAARAHDEVGLPGQSHSGRAPGGRSEASITLGSWSATAKCRLSGPLLGVARPASVIPHLLVSRRTLVVESPDQRANPSSAHFRPAHTWQSVRLPHRFPHSGPWVAGTGSAPEVAAQPCGSGRLRHPVKADRVTVCRELGRTPAPTSLDSPLPARAIQQRTWNTFPTSPAGRDAQIGSFPLPGPPIDGCRKAPVCGCVNPTTNCSTPLGCVTYS